MFNLDLRNMIILFCCGIENPYYTRAVKKYARAYLIQYPITMKIKSCLKHIRCAVSQATRNLSYHIKIPEKCNV